MTLTPQDGIAGDRRFALARPDTVYDPAAPAWVGKHLLEVLAHDPRLARFSAHYEADTLTLTHDGKPLATATRAHAWAPVLDALTLALGQPVRLIELPQGRLTDRPEPFISLITTASLAALSRAAERPLDSRRFRANILLSTDDPFIERNWIGKTLSIGNIRMTIMERINRCCATHADPDTGEYDINMVQILRQQFDRRDFGVFARVTHGGPVTIHDTVIVDDQSL